MINIIMWSKDRAAQLDLTLQTMKNFFVEWKEQTVNIIYTHSNDLYKQGYDKVISLHPEFNWIKETNFRENTLTEFNRSNKKYVTFLVDDDIFLREFSLKDGPFVNFFNDETISCMSCRLAPYINFCYTQNTPAKQPILNDNNMWIWKENCSGDWQYPWSVAAFHLFRKEDLMSINSMNFRAPNTFEAALCSIPFTGKDFMICYKEARTFTACINRVQSENNNRHTGTLDILESNKLFLEGKRLDSMANANGKFNACHGPIKCEWK